MKTETEIRKLYKDTVECLQIFSRHKNFDFWNDFRNKLRHELGYLQWILLDDKKDRYYNHYLDEEILQNGRKQTKEIKGTEI